MKVAVLGLWHLGSVTAACTAGAGHEVVGWDPDADVVAALAQGRPPVAEPGLADLVARELASSRLRVTTELASAVAAADIVWVAFDSIAAGRRVGFACSPENLRLGKAIEVFTRPDRVVIGVGDAAAKGQLLALFEPITDRLEWMSVESAEMTKHAINAFLATSVTFINEIATLCERTGADAKEVERGLKTERRIGPHAYLGPGAAFAGGTLARDVQFLRAIGREVGCETPLMAGVDASNREHRLWARRHLQALLGPLTQRTVAVWGLTYKPGTDTLRRSTAVELCGWLLEQGAYVRAHDPAARALPGALAAVKRCATPVEAAMGAEALVVATEWPEYRRVDVDELAGAMAGRRVIDANRFLGPALAGDPRFNFVAVGGR